MRSLIPTLPFSPVLLALLFGSSQVTPADASLGVVDIDSLLHTKDQQPIRAAADAQDDGPWSHDPYCVRSSKLSSVGKKFCIYTSNMTGPTGISLILTPKKAMEAGPYLDDNPLDNFLTRAQAEDLYLSTSNKPYEVVDMPDKGKGVLATRRIERHETIMVDQAAVVQDMTLEKGVEEREQRILLKKAVEQLRRPAVVRALSGKHNAREDSEEGGDVKEQGKGDNDDGKLEEDIMLTNAFGSDIAGIKCRALYPLVSRINHACNPNAFVLFSRAGISMAVKASRTIEPGEEITVSYVTLGQPFARRAEKLTRWGFTCTCPLCTLPNDLKAESDVRRTLINQATPKIVDLWRDGKYFKAIQVGEETLEMILDEEQEHMLPDHYALLAKLWLAVGERERAEAYGRQSFDLLFDMGFLGVEGQKGEFELEAFLELVGEGIGEAVPQ